ncbi:asparaginase domain-containing protein [Microbacterium resistens]
MAANRTPTIEDELLVVYTGGTFGMRDEGHGLEAAADRESTLAALVRAADPSARPWRYLPIPRIIDSADADLTHALSIAATIRDHVTGARGVLVVHGTDTLAYTAAVAAFALADVPIPIVFTGAQRPVDEPGSDAPANFTLAYRHADDGAPGVRIAFGGSLLPAVRAVKRSADEDEAFAAFRPLAADAAGTAVLRSRLAALDPRQRGGRPLPAVGLLRVFPGLDARLVRAAADLYPDGLILECYGAGTAPTSDTALRQTIEDATRAGTPVVAITQCQTGTVQLRRYAVGAALHRAGAWDGYDLTADAALAKLGVLTALGLDADERRALFAINLVGEQSTG